MIDAGAPSEASAQVDGLPTGRRRGLRAHDAALRTLAGTSVGVGPLATNRQALAVTQAAVAAQVHQPLDVHGHLATEVTLDLVVGLDDLADPAGLLVGEVLRPGGQLDARRHADVMGGLVADAVDVLKRDDSALVGREV